MPLIFLFVHSELEGRTLKIQNSDHGDFMTGSVLLLAWCYCCLLTWFMVCFWHRWRCLWHRRWHFFWEVVWKKTNKQNKTWCLECLDRTQKKKTFLWFNEMVLFPVPFSSLQQGHIPSLFQQKCYIVEKETLFSYNDTLWCCSEVWSTCAARKMHYLWLLKLN